jgi:hypothetical protein
MCPDLKIFGSFFKKNCFLLRVDRPSAGIRWRRSGMAHHRHDFYDRRPYTAWCCDQSATPELQCQQRKNQ